MRLVRWSIVLVLLAALGYGGWRGLQWGLAAWEGATEQAALVARLEHEVDTLRARSEQLNRRELDLAATVQKDAAQLGTLGARVDSGEQGLARLGDAVEGGRTRIQLAAVEQLLLGASDQLLLAHDPSAALQALDLADQRLGALRDPRLFKVREALSQERAALAAVPVADVTGATLALNELLRGAGKLPLRGRVPEHYEAPESPPPPSADGGVLARIWAAVKTALSNIFSLHRIEGPPPRLLPPQEQALVAQVLQLKLEGARLALLARDGRTLHELADGARDWLRLYYDETDPAVKAALAQLDALRMLNLSPPMPELGRSLALLRGALGTR